MNDYSRDKIKDISHLDVKGLVADMVEELHMDCSKKIDPDIFEHTVTKFTNLLTTTQFRELVWKTVQNIAKMGITSSYGAFTRIDYQTLSAWLYKSQPTKTNWADQSIQEAKEMSNLTVGDWGNLSMRWREFREFLEGNGVWFIDNISLSNCNKFHESVRSDNLREFLKMMVTEPDPAYFEKMRKMTLSEFKKENAYEFD